MAALKEKFSLNDNAVREISIPYPFMLRSIVAFFTAAPAAPVYATIEDDAGNILWRIAIRDADAHGHEFTGKQQFGVAGLKLVMPAPAVAGEGSYIAVEYH